MVNMTFCNGKFVDGNIFHPTYINLFVLPGKLLFLDFLNCIPMQTKVLYQVFYGHKLE